MREVNFWNSLSSRAAETLSSKIKIMKGTLTVYMNCYKEKQSLQSSILSVICAPPKSFERKIIHFIFAPNVCYVNPITKGFHWMGAGTRQN